MIEEAKDFSKIILEHAWVPKHEVLGKAETEEVLKQYTVSLQNLPKVLKSDPVVKIIGAKPGDVIKITRQDSSVYYRVVI
ncbi:MAG TPA: DNA-directed RNA polymerase subunit H [archaeon]|nr:DNA-directed RNA polymerase subunit H [archaeon]HLD80533.1 DNA-directed RNA polymerase subunit H [archaeon]